MLWYIARGIQFERGVFAFCVVQGDDTRPEMGCSVVQESGDGVMKIVG